MYKRPLNLTAGILGVVSFSISCLLTIFLQILSLIAFVEVVNILGYGISILVGELILCLVLFSFTIVSLILAAKAIGFSNLTPELYSKKKATIIVYIVFALICSVLLAFSISEMSDPLINITYIFLILVISISVILFIVDLSRNSTLKPIEVKQKNTVPVMSDTSKVINPSSVVENNCSELEKELSKLASLKEKNIISEEEFKQLKSVAISKFTK